MAPYKNKKLVPPPIKSASKSMKKAGIQSVPNEIFVKLKHWEILSDEEDSSTCNIRGLAYGDSVIKDGTFVELPRSPKEPYANGSIFLQPNRWWLLCPPQKKKVRFLPQTETYHSERCQYMMTLLKLELNGGRPKSTFLVLRDWKKLKGNRVQGRISASSNGKRVKQSQRIKTTKVLQGKIRKGRIVSVDFERYYLAIDEPSYNVLTIPPSESDIR